MTQLASYLKKSTRTFNNFIKKAGLCQLNNYHIKIWDYYHNNLERLLSINLLLILLYSENTYNSDGKPEQDLCSCLTNVHVYLVSEIIS